MRIIIEYSLMVMISERRMKNETENKGDNYVIKIIGKFNKNEIYDG